MRRTVFAIVCVVTAGFYTGLNAQIPENIMFQPGSYAVPYRTFPTSPPMYAAPAPVSAMEYADDSRTEWERHFSPQMTTQRAAPASASVYTPQPYMVPHLTFVYNRWTGRFHIAPYEPGYAANPSAFPVQTSPRHIWVSSKSSAAQPSPQVPYMSYYDPDPVVLPAEIQMRGTKSSAPFTQIEPMPLPVPRPATAEPITPPARSRLGERIRQNYAPFIVR